MVLPPRLEDEVPDHSTFSKNRHGRRQRKKVEMLFAHLKRNLRFERLRLRGLSGASDEFLLAATLQNLRRLAKLVGEPPTPRMAPA
jgi:IS5 family transposase